MAYFGQTHSANRHGERKEMHGVVGDSRATTTRTITRWFLAIAANLVVGGLAWSSSLTSYTLSPLLFQFVLPPVAAVAGYQLLKGTRDVTNTSRPTKFISRIAFLPLLLGAIIFGTLMPFVLIYSLMAGNGIAGENEFHYSVSPDHWHSVAIYVRNPLLSVNDASVSVRVAWRFFPLIERDVYDTSSESGGDPGMDVRWRDSSTLVIRRQTLDGTGKYIVVDIVKV